jgi:hypothetical protein
MSDDAHRNPIVAYAGTFWRELSGPGVGTEIWTTHAFQLGERQMGSSSVTEGRSIC